MHPPIESPLTFGALVRRSGNRLPLIGASALLGSLSMLALPLTLASAVDAVVSGRGTAGAAALAAALVLLGVVCDLVDAFAGAACTADAAAQIRTSLLRRMLAAPQHVDRFDTGDLVARTSAGAADAAHAGPAAVSLVASVLPPLGSLAMLAWLDWRLAVVFTAGLALVAGVLRLFATQTASAAADYQAAQGRIAARFTEALTGSRTIAAAGTTGAEARRILLGLPELARHGRAAWQALAAAGARAALAGPLAMVGVLVAAGFLLSRGQISAGELIAAGQYAMMGAGLGSLTGVIAGTARAKAATVRLAEVHDLPPMVHGERELRPRAAAAEAACPHHAVRLPAPEGIDEFGRLDFRSVTVADGANPSRNNADPSTSGDSKLLLDSVSFTIPGGALAAVVGASGSGKSVLASTAARLRDPDSGSVLLDGVPLPQLSHRALRGAVGLATERPALAGATIADAIGPGRTRAQTTAVAEAVGAHEFAIRLPMAYDMPLSETPMSGGEAQRIGLARAWRADRLLVLDDATSSLDAISEQRIEAALDSSGRTRLWVTHRTVVAERADLVLWLHAGTLRAIGSHATMWTDPDYRAVFQQ